MTNDTTEILEGDTPTPPTAKRRKRRTRANDPRFDLHKRLDLFLDNPTNPYHLDSLVSGLIGYELRARLTNTNTNTH